jgi:hypothetical protein
MLSALMTLGAVSREAVLQGLSLAGLLHESAQPTLGPVSIFAYRRDHSDLSEDEARSDVSAAMKAKTAAMVLLNILLAREEEAEHPLSLESRVLVRRMVEAGGESADDSQVGCRILRAAEIGTNIY